MLLEDILNKIYGEQDKYENAGDDDAPDCLPTLETDAAAQPERVPVAPD